MAILKGHTLKSFGLDQHGFMLHSRISFHFRNLALLIHALSLTLKARLGWAYFAIYQPFVVGANFKPPDPSTVLMITWRLTDANLMDKAIST